MNILTYGTFDILHYGHINLLARAKGLSPAILEGPRVQELFIEPEDISHEYSEENRLFVGLSSDEFTAFKGKKTFYDYAHRRHLLSSIKYVDEIIPEHSFKQKIGDIKHFSIDVFVMGSDWVGEFDYLDKLCHVVYLPRTLDISSTILKGYLGEG